MRACSFAGPVRRRACWALVIQLTVSDWQLLARILGGGRSMVIIARRSAGNLFRRRDGASWRSATYGRQSPGNYVRRPTPRRRAGHCRLPSRRASTAQPGGEEDAERGMVIAGSMPSCSRSRDITTDTDELSAQLIDQVRHSEVRVSSTTVDLRRSPTSRGVEVRPGRVASASASVLQDRASGISGRERRPDRDRPRPRCCRLRLAHAARPRADEPRHQKSRDGAGRRPPTSCRSDESKLFKQTPRTMRCR